jgi:hypothetical protein
VKDRYELAGKVLGVAVFLSLGCIGVVVLFGWFLPPTLVKILLYPLSILVLLWCLVFANAMLVMPALRLVFKGETFQGIYATMFMGFVWAVLAITVLSRVVAGKFPW